jgi:hypothetical protein
MGYNERMGSYTVERVQDGKVISRIDVNAGSGVVTVSPPTPKQKAGVPLRRPSRTCWLSAPKGDPIALTCSLR